MSTASRAGHHQYAAAGCQRLIEPFASDRPHGGIELHAVTRQGLQEMVGDDLARRLHAHGQTLTDKCGRPEQRCGHRGDQCRRAETRMSRKMAYQKRNRVSAEVSESSSHDSGRAKSSIKPFVCAAEFGPPEKLFAPVDSGTPRSTLEQAGTS